MRRAITALVLLAILAAAAWTILRWNSGRDDAPDPWRAIPSQAAVIIELPQAVRTWDSFTRTSLFWNTWKQRPAAVAFAQRMAQCSVAMEKDPALAKMFEGESLLIAWVRSGARGSDVLFAFGLKDASAGTKNLTALGATEAQCATLANGQVVDIGAFFIAVNDRICMLSTSRALVEEGILQVESGAPLLSDTVCARAYATLGRGTDAHVLLHTTRTSGILGSTWEQERIDRAQIPDGWLAMDLDLGTDALQMSGLLVPSGSGSVLRSINEQGGGAWNIGRVLPASVVQWEVRHVEDGELFTVTEGDSTQTMSSTPLPWLYGPSGIATACDSAGKPTRHWLVLGAGDVEEAREFLQRGCDGPCDTLNYRGTRISHYTQPFPLMELPGCSTELPVHPRWAVLGQSVVLSDAVDAVRSAVDTWNDGNSLAEDKRTSTCFQRMTDDAAYTWWCDPARGMAVLREGLREGQDSLFGAWLPIMADLVGASVQVSPAQHGMLHVSMGLWRAQGTTTSAATPTNADEQWSCSLKDRVVRIPQLVINHVDQTREVLVQDEANALHLISSAGAVLWSRPLEGPIMGEVHQVDRFRNGKLQLLFNTASTVHMLDRNGKDVAGFPYKLSSPATAPLAVFDYDGERDYRVLVPTQDRHIINITGEGAAVEGWMAPQLGAEAIAQAYHLRVRNKDNLLVIDGKGKPYLFDRKGNAREQVEARLKGIARVDLVSPASELMMTIVRWTDTDGLPHATMLDGTDVLRAEHGSTLLVGDLDGDGVIDRVSMANDTVWLASAGHKVPALLDGNVPDRALALPSGSASFCALSSSTTGQAWLVDGEGHARDGWPKPGTTPPLVGDVDRDGRLESITVTSEGRVVAYRSATQ